MFQGTNAADKLKSKTLLSRKEVTFQFSCNQVWELLYLFVHYYWNNYSHSHGGIYSPSSLFLAEVVVNDICISPWISPHFHLGTRGMADLPYIAFALCITTWKEEKIGGDGVNMTKCINASEHMKGSITRFFLCPYFSEISFLAFISAILHYKSEGGEVPSKYLLRLSAA